MLCSYSGQSACLTFSSGAHSSEHNSAPRCATQPIARHLPPTPAARTWLYMYMYHMHAHASCTCRMQVPHAPHARHAAGVDCGALRVARPRCVHHAQGLHHDSRQDHGAAAVVRHQVRGAGAWQLFWLDALGWDGGRRSWGEGSYCPVPCSAVWCARVHHVGRLDLSPSN